MFFLGGAGEGLGDFGIFFPTKSVGPPMSLFYKIPDPPPPTPQL